MANLEARIAREAKAVTRKEVILKAIEKRITWLQAAAVLGISARHMRRLKEKYETYGFGGLRDRRAGAPRRKRIPVKDIEKLCRLKRDVYPDFSIQHFFEKATEKHGIKISYTWTRIVLENAGLVEKAPGRGKYRRRRERRPMTGMLVHMDASTHEWVKGQPKRDLVVAMDDADGRILYAGFFEQEGTMSTFIALKALLKRYGRFCELYTDRGGHFCRTTRAADGPDEVQDGQVSRALKALGIRQILARTPQARGRSERLWETLQGRLPQELRAAGIKTYGVEADRFLAGTFVPDINRRFTVQPQERDTAFVPIVGIDLELLLTSQHQRVVNNDSTVMFNGRALQLPRRPERPHFVRCPVLVHELTDGNLAVSYQGVELARYGTDGQLLDKQPAQRRAS